MLVALGDAFNASRTLGLLWPLRIAPPCHFLFYAVPGRHLAMHAHSPVDGLRGAARCAQRRGRTSLALNGLNPVCRSQCASSPCAVFYSTRVDTMSIDNMADGASCKMTLAFGCPTPLPRSQKNGGAMCARSRTQRHSQYRRNLRMVLEGVRGLDDARNARLGIAELWGDVALPGTASASALSSPVPGDSSSETRADEGDGSNQWGSSKSVLPWDTTTGAHGISYLQRRMEFLRKRQIILRKSYDECRRITAAFSKTFFMGSNLLSPEKRHAVWAVYTWCRRTDDLVDGPRVQQRTKQLNEVLEDWELRLDDVFKRGVAKDALDLALVDVVNKFPLVTPTPFRDMIEGMRMDVEQARFETFDDLYLYCYRVAGTVGLMTLPIMGTVSPGRKGLREAAESALALGIGLQLTNILRDVGEDRLRGRIYLPQEDLKRFNYTEEDLFNCVLDRRYAKLMKFQIERARSYFKKAESGVHLLNIDSRLPVRASLDMYSQILEEIEANGYDNFHKRAYVSKAKKLLTVPLSWMRVQDGQGWKNAAEWVQFFLGRKKEKGL